MKRTINVEFVKKSSRAIELFNHVFDTCKGKDLRRWLGRLSTAIVKHKNPHLAFFVLEKYQDRLPMVALRRLAEAVLQDGNVLNALSEIYQIDDQLNATMVIKKQKDPAKAYNLYLSHSTLLNKTDRSALAWAILSDKQAQRVVSEYFDYGEIGLLRDF